MAAETQQGRIHQLNISAGGVPKWPVPSAVVTVEGIEGDVQRDRRHHGGPERAVCLFTLEVIQQLNAEGHPIFPGSVGENVTLAGIDLAALLPGTRLALGDEVELEITSYAIPCRNITESFNDGDMTRIGHKHHPGESRVYARVLHGGRLAVGQPVALLTDATV